MSFFHGIKGSQVPTSLIATRAVSAAILVAVGCAPIHRLSNQDNAATNGKLALCYSYSEAAAALGCTPDDDFDRWGLSEAAYSQLILFTAAPVIFINLFDPDVHKASVLNEQDEIIRGAIQLANTDALEVSGIEWTDPQGGTGTATSDDYTLDKARGVILVKPGGSMPMNGTATVTYSYAVPEDVTASDAIGGADYDTGLVTGLQLLDLVFPKYRLVPGVIIAPGFSDNPSVAAVMATKAGSINTIFRAVALADLPVDVLKNYTLVPEYKNLNNLVQEDLYLCWPRVIFNEKVMRMATQAAGVIASTDADNDDVPYVSPSNKNLQAQGIIASKTVTDDQLWLTLDQANYLNANGIATALNFIGGWKLWGNRMSCYPDVTDIKDTFITNRRMMGWYGNNLILTWWAKIDAATNRRLIQTILNSEQITLNSMTAAGYILGGRIEFDEAENSLTDLMEGSIRFHVWLGTASPAEQIEFALEYDPQYLSTLFA